MNLTLPSLQTIWNSEWIFPAALNRGKRRAEGLDVVRREKIPEPSADHLFPGVAEGLQPHRVHLDDAAVFVEGLISYRSPLVEQAEALFALAELFPDPVFFADIPEYQHHARDAAIGGRDGRAGIGDLTLAAVLGDEQGMICQPDDHALLQDLLYRILHRLPRVDVHDAEDFSDRPATGLRGLPTRETLGHGIHFRDISPGGVADDHTVADRVQRGPEVFLFQLDPFVRLEELEGHLDRSVQDRDARGLDHVTVGSDLFRESQHFGLSMTGKEDDGDIAPLEYGLAALEPSIPGPRSMSMSMRSIAAVDRAISTAFSPVYAVSTE